MKAERKSKNKKRSNPAQLKRLVVHIAPYVIRYIIDPLILWCFNWQKSKRQDFAETHWFDPKTNLRWPESEALRIIDHRIRNLPLE